MLRKLQWMCVILASVLLTGCVPASLTMKATKPLIQSTFSVVMNEPDLTIAKTAIESDLKLLEGVLQVRPKDRELLELAAMGYFAYSFAYAEDDSIDRAMRLYQRARDFSQQSLATYGISRTTIQGTTDEFAAAISNLPKQANGVLFWGGLAWAMQILNGLDQPEYIADLPKVEALFDHLCKSDSAYFFGGPLLFQGAWNGFRPKVFGGNPVKAEAAFNACRAVSNGKFLLERVFRARYLYVPLLEEEKFNSELQAVINAPDDVLPEYRLLTAIAKSKARRYLARVTEWF